MRTNETMLDALNAGLHMIGHAFVVFRRFPVFILPLLGCWIVYAVIILYLEFGSTGNQILEISDFLSVFALIFVFTSVLAFSGFVVLELIQQVESGRTPKLFAATRDALRENFVKAIPIILVWSALWFVLTVLSAIFSRRKSDRGSDRLSMQSAARTFAKSDTSFFSFRNYFRMLNKALRMQAFLILPAIAWLNCGPSNATKLGHSVSRQHLKHFASGFILSEGVAMIIFLPAGLLIVFVDQGNYSLPDAIWLGVIIYCAVGWSLVIYVEQMFAAELFLWHLKWSRENERRASLNLPAVALGEVARPDLLDDVSELLI